MSSSDATQPADETPDGLGASADAGSADTEIDLGQWPGLDLSSIVEKQRPVENTRAALAFCLVGLLAVVLLLLLLLLWFRRVPVDAFAQVAGLLISPLVGLVGAVTGYYYGRGDRR
jgi:hypothetical protein